MEQAARRRRRQQLHHAQCTRGFAGEGHIPLACSPAFGEACYFAALGDFNAHHSPHPNAVGQAFFSLSIGVAGMTVSEVKGFGRQKGQTEIYRGAEYSTNMLPKVKLEIAASDALAAQVVETIQQTASTDSIGDGKIFVLDLASTTRIRTGESGDNAL